MPGRRRRRWRILTPDAGRAVSGALLLVVCAGGGGALASPPHVGGYASARARSIEHRSTRFDLRDLSVLLSWEASPRWRTFAELEVGDAVTWDARGLRTSDAEFDLERLYAEYDVDPAMHLRIGKFLTPVGHWNLVHADPLVWTVTRPLSTGVSFARHSTGLYLEGAASLHLGELTYIAYADDSRALDPDRGELGLEDSSVQRIPNGFENAFGIHLLLEPAGGGQVGLSYADFRLQGTHRRKHLFGLDARYRWRRLMLSSELVYRLSEGGAERDEWGGFLQGVVPLWRGLHAVARYERFRLAADGSLIDVGLVGLAWHMAHRQVVKLEFRSGRNNARTVPDGWLASYAVLF